MAPDQNNFLLQRIPVLNAVFAAVAYLTTIAPTISHTDSGELAAVAYTGGVAHPTGYPLFSIIGWLWTRIEIVAPALQLNFLCMLFVAGGVYFFSRGLHEFFSNWLTKFKSSPKEGAKRSDAFLLFGNIMGSLGFAFGQTIWMQSTSWEVYSLHILLMGLTTWLLLRAWYSDTGSDRPWLILSVALALGFANHLTFFTILPGIAWLYFAKFGYSREAFIRIAKMLGVFIPLLILQYAYLPLRAMSDPNLNWGNPETWAEFYHHVTGRQFSVWLFTGSEAFKEMLGNFLSTLPANLGYIMLLPIPFGIYYGWKVRKNETIAFLLILFTNSLYVSNYRIKDLEPYFIPTLMMLAIFAVIGLRYFWIKVRLAVPVRTGLIAFVALAIAMPLVLNHPKVNQRGVWMYEDYARAALSSLPENALVVSKTWDSFISAAYYLQEVEGYRTDVDIIGYNMLRDRHWYPEHFRINAPESTERMAVQLDRWDEVIGDFDIKGIVNAKKLGESFTDLFYMILAEFRHRPVYLGWQIFPETMQSDGLPMPEEITIVPDAFFYKVIPRNQVSIYSPIADQKYDIRLPAELSEPEAFILRESWAVILSQRIVYEYSLGKIQKAKALKSLLLEIHPDRNLSPTLKNI